MKIKYSEEVCREIDNKQLLKKLKKTIEIIEKNKQRLYFFNLEITDLK